MKALGCKVSPPEWIIGEAYPGRYRGQVGFENWRTWVGEGDPTSPTRQPDGWNDGLNFVWLLTSEEALALEAQFEAAAEARRLALADDEKNRQVYLAEIKRAYGNSQVAEDLDDRSAAAALREVGE